LPHVQDMWASLVSNSRPYVLETRLKPYYEHAGITIYHGDCREILPRLDTTDLILTDPPYNAANIGPNHRVYQGSIMQLPADQYIKFCSDWFTQTKAKRTVFTPGIANTHNYPQPKWQLCWHKPASVSFNRMGGFNAWEPVFVYGDTKKVRIGKDYLLYNTLNFSKGAEKDHPCPKPITLWGYLLDKFLFEGETVIAPFLGSGTTAFVAKSRGKKCIGIEIEEKYCEIAAKRLSQEVFNFWNFCFSCS